jgi:hypothetical protein
MLPRVLLRACVLLAAVGTGFACATGGISGDNGDSGSSDSSVPSDGASSSGSGKGWYCGEANGVCQCFTQPVQGYTAPTCTASYSCCATQPYNGGKTCGCTNSSPCSPAAGATKVSKCPQ